MDPILHIGEAEATLEFLAGGGEMGRRIREFDWAKTPLGPVQTWPHSLRTCIRIMLTSRQPIWMGWGKELIKLYNDPYKDIVGGKHPWALGTPASLVWKDIWKDIAPMLQKVMEKNEGTYVEAQLLIMERNGYKEETYYTFSYTPVPGDHGGTAGMICFNSDDTDRIISERQLKTLTQLGKNLTDTKSTAEVVDRLMKSLLENPWDFPFALFYTLSGNTATISHHTGAGDAPELFPATIDMNGHGGLSPMMQEAAVTRAPVLIEQIDTRIGKIRTTVWETPPTKAILLPIVQLAGKSPVGFLLIGLNPHRLADEKYLGLFSLVADQVVTSLSGVHALEEERKRAEALAAIDRSKTIFFSNISHEFRTPLALLLGPIGELLTDPALDPSFRTNLDIAYRNAIRMQKLVNTLLEFSRIEAGRMEGRFSAVDIGQLTGELASTFRSAVEKAGMKLRIDLQPIREPVFVDADMWEKIVLNLVSNAFKYTRQGEIRVGMRQSGDSVMLSVEDTGIGIPADQLDKIFDRFHRVASTEGRSQEGTGIGLAMVKELVKLHHGLIEVKSRPGEGTIFIVSLPTGKDHLPTDKIVTAREVRTGELSAAFVEEAGKWLPSSENFVTAGNKEYKVLLADDNADMRQYVSRLLSRNYTVITAVDGEDAFAKVQEHSPDLILSDIMMPRLDGFGLLKRLRDHPATRNLPIVFLSARAGEEAKVEGLDAGADDYLVKPFSARELMAVVDANIRINIARRAAEQDLYAALMDAPFGIVIFSGEDYHVELANQPYATLMKKTRRELIGNPIFDILPEAEEQGFRALMNEIKTTGLPYTLKEFETGMITDGKMGYSYYNIIYQPMKKHSGRMDQIMVVVDDVTDQVLARKKIQEMARKESAVLEEMVKERTRQLEESNFALQQSNADLQQFAHVASHDLKEPLRKIKIFSGRLEDDHTSQFSDKGRLYLEKIQGALDRMIAMVEGVLDYSSLNAIEQDIQHVPLTQVMQQIEQDLELLIAGTGARIRYEELPVIQGSSVLIHQLIYNLIANSLKFSVPGRPPLIEIGHSLFEENGGAWLRLSISDNGIGFSAEASERIFVTFARLHSKDKYEGTGLGLSLCKKIVERHGGRIMANGIPGEGAVFDIELPVLQVKTTI